ncbi:MAG: hypothetical protein QOK41_185, partial [Sphingomonadales bacterium]|nr:hypothetical protein [Sphingomonadales bacterium]
LERFFAVLAKRLRGMMPRVSEA